MIPAKSIACSLEKILILSKAKVCSDLSKTTLFCLLLVGLICQILSLNLISDFFKPITDILFWLIV